MKIEINLRKEINEVYQQSLYDDKRWLILYGGAGSGKSHFAAQKVLIRIMSNDKHKIVVTRKVAKTLRISVFALMLSIISSWGLASHFQTNKTDMTITFKPNGNQVLCIGLDDPEKIKSIAGITSFWHEEPTELTEEDLNQLDLRLRGETDSYKQHILTFNPIKRSHWLKKKLFDSDIEKPSRLKTTYKDNRFIDAEYKERIELLKETNSALYEVYGLGNWGDMKGLIYKPALFDAWPGSFDETIYGLDFGYNNPSALLEINLKDVDRRKAVGDIYVRELLYRQHLTSSELAAAINALKIKGDIYCDSASPEQIKELKNNGLKARAAKKGQGSVLAGIKRVQNLTIHSLEANTNFNKEMECYSWKLNKEGAALDEPVKFDDHAMDAMRYPLFTVLAKPKAEFINRRDIGF